MIEVPQETKNDVEETSCALDMRSESCELTVSVCTGGDPSASCTTGMSLRLGGQVLEDEGKLVYPQTPCPTQFTLCGALGGRGRGGRTRLFSVTPHASSSLTPIRVGVSSPATTMGPCLPEGAVTPPSPPPTHRSRGNAHCCVHPNGGWHQALSARSPRAKQRQGHCPLPGADL
jgi:hypothetical protein